MRRFLAALGALIMISTTGLQPAQAEVDVYSTPGEHTVNGRQWRTWCEPYSATARCRTDLLVGGKWVFNNLTYLPSPARLWAGNPLATPGKHVINGRAWMTECGTPRTGRGGCRSYIDVKGEWVFNSMLRFGVTPSNLEALYKYRPPATPAPKPTPTPSKPPVIDSYNRNKGPNTTDRVTLTFDDCPKSLSSFKATVLSAEQNGISLALFPTGDCLTAGRFDASFARAHGHYVFNHSVSHPDLTTISYASVLKQLSAPGVVTTYGRPPYGAWNSSVAKAYEAKGMRIWMWNYDTIDYRGHSSATLIDKVVSNAKPGYSVLMHMQWNGFNGPTIKAMKDGLAKKGIGVCRNLGPTEVKPSAMNC